MNKTGPYDALIRHTRNWIFDLPDSDLLIPLLKKRFTPEEAGFLARFPHIPITLEQLSEQFGIPEEEFEAYIQPMIRKGFIYRVEGRSAVRYTLTDPIFFLERMPGWKGEDNDWNREIAPMINQYYIRHQGADFLGHPTKGLRAIPVVGTITDTREILPYENVLQFVEQEEYHTVSTCACRHRHNMDPNFPACKNEMEVCLHFGRLGKYIVKHDMGREITREETLEILKNAADAGLVHGISNTRHGMDTICNCCACCCLFLEPLELPHGVKREYHQPSNYRVEHNDDTCIACGKCAKRCPIDAIRLEPREDLPEPEDGKKLRPRDLKKVVYDPSPCIGCGVCVHKCPTGSIYLVKKDTVEDIPESFSDAGMRMLKERERDLTRIY
jgi:NAD-dependent dihydropyrimidine dehydrogenase PreA subunit